MEDPTETQQIVHFHNYSMYAVKALICEIKRFPIIYKNHKDICYARELIELAWCRIVSAVLDCDGQFSSTERAYWDMSFRELWKWMRSLLVRDMKSRIEVYGYVRDPKYNWLDYLKFAEKHISLEQETAERDGPGKGIHIQLISAETIRESAQHTVIWVRDSRETTDNETEGVSICLRAPLGSSKDLFMSTHISPVPRNNFMTNSCPVLEPVSSSIPSSSTTDNPISSGIQCSSVEIVNEGDLIVPRQQAQVQIVIDEDFQFIMSLLPKLKKLKPKVNTEVKTMIMQALHEAF